MPHVNREKIIFNHKGKLVSSHDLNKHSIWSDRLSLANEKYDLWARKFRVNELEEAYYGFQWDKDAFTQGYNPYVQNAIFVAIDIKSPALFFTNPIFSIESVPLDSNFEPEKAEERARLKQDVLNFLAIGDRIGLSSSVELNILDSFFRFGIAEVGYSADWIENPRAGKPALAADENPLKNNTGEIVKEPKRLPQSERIYVKYISSRSFRIGGLDNQKLDKCSWVGYSEWVRTEDILSSDKFDLKDINLGSSSGRSSDYSGFIGSSSLDEEDQLIARQGDMTKWWKIWDLRTRKMIFYLEPEDKIIREKSFKRLPLFSLKFRERLNSFYPLPIVFNWISPQAEINETREAARAHRRMFQRKFVYSQNAFEPEELDKLQHGGDGTFVETKRPNATGVIEPIKNADLGGQHVQALVSSRNDFDNIAGISLPQKGESAGDTATEATIIDKRSSIRESRDVSVIKKFILEIGREVLLLARDKFVNDFWIKLFNAETDETFGIIEETVSSWKKVSPELFGDDDFELNLDVASLSPLIQDSEKKKYLEFIAILNSFPFISMSPELVRETARVTGYKNRRVLSVFQQMAQAIQVGREEEEGGGEGGIPENQIAQREVAQASPNTLEQINNQINNQSVQ